MWASQPVVDMVPYLRHLVARLTGGGRMERRPVASLDELATQAPRIVNSAELGARELVVGQFESGLSPL